MDNFLLVTKIMIDKHDEPVLNKIIACHPKKNEPRAVFEWILRQGQDIYIYYEDGTEELVPVSCVVKVLDSWVEELS